MATQKSTPADLVRLLGRVDADPTLTEEERAEYRDIVLTLAKATEPTGMTPGAEPTVHLCRPSNDGEAYLFFKVRCMALYSRLKVRRKGHAEAIRKATLEADALYRADWPDSGEK